MFDLQCKVNANLMPVFVYIQCMCDFKVWKPKHKGLSFSTKI